MIITYIGHSGFLVELENCYLIFDYYYGDLPELNSEKLTVIFGSHSHQDHYNPEIFEKIRNQKQIVAVLSDDIYRSRVPKDIQCHFVKHNEQLRLLGEIEIETLHSTDKGVAFLVTAGGTTIYHAGDLNDWVWDGDTLQEQKTMTGMYRKEVNKLKGRAIDVAFLPLDGRQEQYFDRGTAFFLKEIQPKWAIPMHFWDRPEVIDEFCKKYPQYAQRVVALEENGQRFNLKHFTYLCQ